MADRVYELAIRIGFPEKESRILSEYTGSYPAEVSATADRIGENGAYELSQKAEKGDNEAALLLLCGCLECAFRAKVRYDEKGIPEDIYYDTMNDIVVWAGNHLDLNGSLGITNASWLCNHFGLRLFKIGRLQYAFEGHALGLHIQQNRDSYRGRNGEDFSPASIDASMEKAKAFFRTYYPDFEFDRFNCESWLLAPNLANVLPADSDILAFGRRFKLRKVHLEDRQSEERVFGFDYEKKTLDEYPRNTRLQKALYDYLKAGGQIGSASGSIEL